MLEGREVEEEEEHGRGIASKLTLPADVEPPVLPPWPLSKPLQHTLYATSLKRDDVKKALEANRMDFHAELAKGLDYDRKCLM